MILGEAIRAEIEELSAPYPERRGGLLPALHVVQRVHGFISPEAARELAELFELKPNDVMEVVSFYNMFDREPTARHQVKVCTNLPCALRGARTLLSQLASHLDVSVGEATRDGRVHLDHEECLGACAYAPMMRVGATYYEDLDFEKASAILDELE